MLIDTDILIWHMRGYEHAGKVITDMEYRHISIVTQMKLIQGLRNKEEQRALHRFLDRKQFVVYPVSENISQHALFLMEDWYPSYRMAIADVLIAATAIEYGLPRLTGNIKHYEFLSSLTLKYFRPDRNDSGSPSFAPWLRCCDARILTYRHICYGSCASRALPGNKIQES